MECEITLSGSGAGGVSLTATGIGTGIGTARTAAAAVNGRAAETFIVSGGRGERCELRPWSGRESLGTRGRDTTACLFYISFCSLVPPLRQARHRFKEEGHLLT